MEEILSKDNTSETHLFDLGHNVRRERVVRVVAHDQALHLHDVLGSLNE